jgi:hypothetical protein
MEWRILRRLRRLLCMVRRSSQEKPARDGPRPLHKPRKRPRRIPRLPAAGLCSGWQRKRTEIPHSRTRSLGCAKAHPYNVGKMAR